jgi:hypothetical protein
MIKIAEAVGLQGQAQASILEEERHIREYEETVNKLV